VYYFGGRATQQLNKKVYKHKKTVKVMVKTQYIFYVIGIIFLFATVVYFSYEFLLDLPDIIKTIILICLTIAFFFAADFMEGKDI